MKPAFECSRVTFRPEAWRTMVLAGTNPADETLLAADGWRLIAVPGAGYVLVERNGMQSVLPWHCVTCCDPVQPLEAPRGRGRPPKKDG